MAKLNHIKDPLVCFKMVADLIRRADELGYIVTAEQVPKTPLAMRNNTTRVRMRPKLVREGE